MSLRTLVRAVISEHLRESTIIPPNIPGTKNFWHGGDLDFYDDSISHRKGRNEYGPGLYLITHFDTARKYAKGGRKFYMVTVQDGNDMKDAFIPFEQAKEFIQQSVVGIKRKDVLERMTKYLKEGQGIPASIFNNILINENAVKTQNMGALRQFYVDNGIDYVTVDNPFGFHETMLVLFNMGTIVEKRRIMPGDKIEVFDL